MKYFSLEKAAAIFLKSREKGIQLSFYRESDSVLLQIFKGYDVLTWDWVKELSHLNKNSIVFLIHFHKDKEYNEVNLKNFYKTTFFSDYKLFHSEDETTYLYALNFPFLFRKQKFIKKIQNTIEAIYVFEQGEEVKLSLDVY